MERDFAKLIKDSQRGPFALRVLQIHWATMSHLTLRLAVGFGFAPTRNSPTQAIIRCSNAVDYSIRPKNPATIEGGPIIEYYETHKLLEDERLQLIPGGDGEVFNPPLKLSLLIFDRSHVIADKFQLEEPKPGMVPQIV